MNRSARPCLPALLPAGPAGWLLAGCSLLAAVALLPGCKTRPRGGVYIQHTRKPDKGLANNPDKRPTTAEVVAELVKQPQIRDLTYQRFVRPLLTKQGCDSSACHGAYRGGGMWLRDPSGQDRKDYDAVLSRLDRKEPEKSELVQKMTNQVAHNGGRNIDPKSCSYTRLISWIGGQPDMPCSEPVPDPGGRFAREVAPAMVALGCADKACHGGGPPAARFDLQGLVAAPIKTDKALAELGRLNNHNYLVWLTSIMRAADARDGVHKQKADPLSCAYRRLYGFLASAPELTCELAPKTPPSLPSLQVFTTQVLPVLNRRGCLQTACHGGGVGDMALLLGELGAPTVLHSYLVLLARVEDLQHLGDSTLLRTARNQEPHGGGQRLGGKGDCADDQLVAWLRQQPIKPCPPPTPPTFASFVAQMQPILDKMTCTNPRCHGGAVPRFTLIRQAKEPAQLQANYREVLGHIDYDYPPFSDIMARMREPCAFARTAAWIEKKPQPSCALRDPDPSIFPRPDADGNPVHPKAPPGPPPSLKL